jgi:hypothetical protein
MNPAKALPDVEGYAQPQDYFHTAIALMLAQCNQTLAFERQIHFNYLERTFPLSEFFGHHFHCLNFGFSCWGEQE